MSEPSWFESEKGDVLAVEAEVEILGWKDGSGIEVAVDDATHLRWCEEELAAVNERIASVNRAHAEEMKRLTEERAGWEADIRAAEAQLQQNKETDPEGSSE